MNKIMQSDRRLNSGSVAKRFGAKSAGVAVAIAAVFASQSFGATTYNYIGNNTGDINVATNWSPNAVPSGATSDVLVFDGTTANGLLTLANTGSGPGTAPGVSLSITSTADLTIDSTVGLWRLGTSAVNIASGAGAFSMGNGSGTQVSLAIGSGAGTHAFVNNSSNTATINSDIIFGNGGSAAHTLAFSGPGNWVVNAPIDNTGTDKTQGGGLFSVTKSGTGTLTLGTTANLYSGNTTVSGGTLKAGANNALGYAGQYTLNRAVGITTVDGTNAAAALEIAGGVTVNEPIVLSGNTNGASLVNNTAGTTGTVGSGIAGLQLTVAGTNYGASTGFNSLTTTITGGGGTGATGTAWKGSSAGAGVSVVFMGNAGSGYTSAPTVTITGAGGNGNDATAIAVLSSVTLNGTNNSIGGDGDLVIAAGIKDGAAAGGFTKIGTGTTTLSGVNTFTGAGAVNAGVLNVTSNANAIAVNGGSLGGTGTVGAISANSTGTVAPGVSGIGTLTASSATFATGSTYAADIGTGTSSDSLAVTGALDLSALGDTLNLVALDASSFDGSTKTIATYASLVGTFDAVTLNGAPLVGTPSSFTVNGQTYAVNYGTGTNSAITVSAVPEPAMLGVAALAVGGLVARRRRRD